MGIGIVITGGIILAISLIMGIEFPKFAYRKNVEFLCIYNDKHEYYNQWLEDDEFKRHNLVYFWNITNPEQVINGLEPNLQDIGPYFYRQFSFKLNVQFVGDAIEYRNWKRQEFDGNQTLRSCSKCSYKDRITLINKEYLKGVMLEGDEDSYILSFLPPTLQSVFEQLNQDMSYEEIYREWGNFRSVKFVRYSSKLFYPATFSHLNFASWLQSSTYSSNRTFKADEMQALINVLTSSVLFNDFNQFLRLVRQTDQNNSTVMESLTEFVNSKRWFCQPTCWDLTSDLLVPLADYIIHLIQFIKHRALNLTNQGKVITLTQSEWVIGRTIHWKFGGVQLVNLPQRRLKGILMHDETAAEAIVNAESVRLYSCYSRQTGSKAHMWRSFNGQTQSNSSQFPRATNDQRVIAAYMDSVEPVELTTCQGSSPRMQFYNFFFPVYWRRLPFVWSGKTKDVRRVEAHVLTLNESALKKAKNPFMNEDCLQDMTGTLKFNSWLSLPHFRLCSESLQTSFNASPFKYDLPWIVIEPTSGVVYSYSISHQLVIQHKNSRLPMYWIDERAEVSEWVAKNFRDNTRKILQASCAGLISLSLLAAATIVCGILVGTITFKNGKVLPIPPNTPTF
ncbi:DgyrCDS10803 [Dimorphilus gyrociliatus]|uniref:DgyrCDS10803 n=1 Tax=Dimorphilus gyrociliatus TaxID=2664684 RepID=A0A7I8W3W7_9ANNE|nr:DgyrCDS10803 [Dimorphilus gyrociliatus]